MPRKIYLNLGCGGLTRFHDTENEKWVNAEKNLPMIAFCAMPNNYGTLDEISEKYAMELIVSYRQEKIETDTLTPEQKHAALKKRFLEEDLAAEYAKSYGYFHTRDGVNEDV